jgi:hypothetical protein
MKTAMTAANLTRQASRVHDIKGDTIKDFKNWWTNGEPEKQFVPVGEYLAWLGYNVRSAKHPYAFAAKDWTFSYRSIATTMYKAEQKEDLHVKVMTNGILLFDADFLDDCFEEAQQITVDRAVNFTARK